MTYINNKCTIFIKLDNIKIELQKTICSIPEKFQ
jgi:hypothetical protein